MDVLVVFYQQLRDEGGKQLLKHISLKAQTLVTDSFQDLIAAVERKCYHLTVILTCEKAFPTQWSLHEIPLHHPMIILTSVNLSHFFMLNLWIDSVETAQLQFPNKSILSESLAYIEENLFESDLCLEKAASYSFVSKCHYSRIFQKEAGVGFKEYIINKRIERAKELLLKGEPVTEVCYSIGYNDLTHFARVFKKMVGVNPSMYRQKKREHSYMVLGGVQP